MAVVYKITISTTKHRRPDISITMKYFGFYAAKKQTSTATKILVYYVPLPLPHLVIMRNTWRKFFKHGITPTRRKSVALTCLMPLKMQPNANSKCVFLLNNFGLEYFSYSAKNIHHSNSSSCSRCVIWTVDFFFFLSLYFEKNNTHVIRQHFRTPIILYFYYVCYKIFLNSPLWHDAIRAAKIIDILQNCLVNMPIISSHFVKCLLSRQLEWRRRGEFKNIL